MPRLPIDQEIEAAQEAIADGQKRLRKALDRQRKRKRENDNRFKMLLGVLLAYHLDRGDHDKLEWVQSQLAQPDMLRESECEFMLAQLDARFESADVQAVARERHAARRHDLIGAWVLSRFADGLDIAETAFVDHLRQGKAESRELFAEYFLSEPNPAPAAEPAASSRMLNFPNYELPSGSRLQPYQPEDE